VREKLRILRRPRRGLPGWLRLRLSGFESDSESESEQLHCSVSSGSNEWVDGCES